VSHRLVRGILRLAGFVQRVGPADRDRIEFSALILPTVDLSLFLAVTKQQSIKVTDSGGGSNSEITGDTSVPAGEIWHVTFLQMARLSGDNTANKTLLAYVNQDSDPMHIDSYTQSTSRQFQAGDSQPDFWMYPGDTLGIKFAGDGAAATVMEFQMATVTYVTEADED